MVLLFSLVVMGGLYNGTLEILEGLHFGQRIPYLPPSMPLSLLLLFLFVLLTFSNGIAALSSLFLSKELDLVLSSPIGSPGFFIGKFTEIYSSSSWMALLFGLPTFIALGNFYDASPLYYLAITLALLPLFAIPSAISLILVTIFTTLVPANRTRDFFFVTFGALLALAYFLFGNLKEINEYSAGSFQSIFSIPNSVWLPSYWASIFIGEILYSSSETGLLIYLIALFSVALALISGAYLIVKTFHPAAYSKNLSARQSWGAQSSVGYRIARTISSPLPQHFRAIASKEYKLFARDMSQAMQLVMLLGICLLYLYNFRALQALESLPVHTALWWQAFLLLANMLMGSFVITAIAARFVFPSLSLEGSSFWIYQKAPISLEKVVAAKMLYWFIPISFTSCIIFVSGALAIQATPFMVLCTAALSVLLAFGIVGLALGLGAHFIKLDWEHTAQLTTGFGNLIYMLASTALILVSLLPVLVLVFVYTLRELESKIPQSTWLIVLISTFFLVGIINMLTVRWSFRIARNSLMSLSR